MRLMEIERKRLMEIERKRLVEIKRKRMMEIKEIDGKLAMKEKKMNTMNPNKSQSITINHNLISINHHKSLSITT